MRTYRDSSPQGHEKYGHHGNRYDHQKHRGAHILCMVAFGLLFALIGACISRCCQRRRERCKKWRKNW